MFVERRAQKGKACQYQGTVRQGGAGHCEARNGKALQGMAWQDIAKQDKAGHCKARQGRAF